MLTFNCTLSPQISHLSTAVHRPPLKTTIRNGPEPPVWLAAMYLRSSLHLVGESSYTLFALTEPPLINLFSPSVVGSSSYLINLLPLQLTNRSGYVSYFGFFFSDILVSDSITQRNFEHRLLHSSLNNLKLWQPCRSMFRFHKSSLATCTGWKPSSSNFFGWKDMT